MIITKNYRTTIVVASLVLFILAGIAVYSGSDEVIGIVISVKGSLIHQRGTETKALVLGDGIYKDSTIKLEEGTTKGKVQIGTKEGPVVYTKFPIRLKETAFLSLTADQQKNYISCVGGTILKSRNVTLFDWFLISLGALDEKDIKAGFSLVFSKTKNSSESLILDPLYFKLKDDAQIKSINANLINRENGNKLELENLKIDKRGSDWIIRFDQYDYDYATEYAVKGTVVLMNDKKDSFEFAFFVYGEEEITYIEDEAAKGFLKDESTYGKTIIRAGKYRLYEMHLKGMSLLKEAGIDIDGML